MKKLIINEHQTTVQEKHKIRLSVIKAMAARIGINNSYILMDRLINLSYCIKKNVIIILFQLSIRFENFYLFIFYNYILFLIKNFDHFISVSFTYKYY